MNIIDLGGEHSDLELISKLFQSLAPRYHSFVDQCYSLQDPEGILIIGSVWREVGAFDGEKSRRTLEMAGHQAPR